MIERCRTCRMTAKSHPDIAPSVCVDRWGREGWSGIPNRRQENIVCNNDEERHLMLGWIDHPAVINMTQELFVTSPNTTIVVKSPWE